MSQSTYVFHPICSQNSGKLRFTNIQGFCSIFFACEPFLESSCPGNLALFETNLLTQLVILFICMVLQFIRKNDFLLHVNYPVTLRIFIDTSDMLSFFYYISYFTPVNHNIFLFAQFLMLSHLTVT